MTTSIRPHQLPDALAIAQVPDARVLSLDCFDTLLWRSSYAPTDVFAELAPDPGLRCRVFAESFARQIRHVSGLSPEVDFEQIYRQITSGDDPASAERRRHQVAREMAAEQKHCFGFSPTVELIRRAHAAGLKVIVVSDTYLSEEQLRELLRICAGDGVEKLIDRIFVSSAYGFSKADGLFSHVLPLLDASPAQILHIGDNPIADFEAPSKLGINVLHLEQFGDELTQRLRLEAAVARMLDAEVGISVPNYQPHRAPISLLRGRDPAADLGFGVIGPLFEGFSHWLRHEADALARESSAGMKMLFLLRDGHLPEQVYRALHADAGHECHRVEVSRFAAFAASFTDRQSVLTYVAEFGDSERFDAMSRQLMFTTDEARDLERRARRSARPMQAYVTEVGKPGNLRKIIERSARYADRLVRYLVKHAGVEPGQTLVMVDLGYAGTVQQRIAPVLRERLGVRVEGRYLLMRDVPNWRADRRGLIDPSRFDYRVIDSLCAYVAIIEQLSTAEMASVVDYDADGEPIHKRGDMKQRQSQVRAQVQAACIEYARHSSEAFARRAPAIDVDAWRTAVTGILGRLLFLPSPAETTLFSGFEHDVNMGVDDKVTLFDPEAARDGLLKRGLVYTNDSPRQYLPAELRGQGLSLSLSMFALRRFTPDLRYTDFSDRTLTVPIMVANGADLIQTTCTAHPTHDGYFLAAIPVGDGSLAVGVNFGRLASWLQLHSVTVTRVQAFMDDGDISKERDRADAVVYEAMQRHPGGILQCDSPESFIFVPPEPALAGARSVLSVVFRPLALLQTESRMPATNAASPALASAH